MSRTIFARTGTALVALSALAAGLVVTSAPAHAEEYHDATMDLPRSTSPWPGIGPSRPFVQSINIGGVVPLKNQAMVNRTDEGLLFRGGQQHNNTIITQSNGQVRFVDTGTASWKYLDPSCTKITVPQGVGATCTIASKFADSAPMLIEVWPRLGNDTVDSSALSDRFEISFLGDRGDDVARTGDGADFVNGAQDNDRASGGAGRDWLRTNIGDDWIDGGADGDYLVGVDGQDVIYGGTGDDILIGLAGHDKLYAGEGRDKVSCGAGSDTAEAKSTDKILACESVTRSGS